MIGKVEMEGKAKGRKGIGNGGSPGRRE